MKVYGANKNDIIEAMKSGNITIAVYGLGKMGLPLAAVFADCGARVIGADVSPEVVASINRGECHVVGEPGLAGLVAKNTAAGRLSATSDLVDAAKQADVMVILVPTFLDADNNPDMSIVESVCKNIAQGLDKGDLVIQESTVPPRTTHDVILPLLEGSGLSRGEFGVAHCPERTSSGRAIEDIRGAYPKVVGGVDEASTQAAAAIYSVINSKGVIQVSDATTAEAVKVFEGLYRDVNIALANELAVVCDEIGISAMEAFDVANTQPYSHIHKPGCGVGGHCIPVYPYFITKTVKSDTRLLTLAREINDGMAGYTVELVRRGLGEVGVELKDANVLVLGVTYRGDVKETRCSPALSIIDILKRECRGVFAYDPLFGDDVRQFGAEPRGLDDVEDIDAVVIAADYEEFKGIEWGELRLRHRVLVDGRNVAEGDKFIGDGFVYKGIGMDGKNVPTIQ